VFECVCLFDTWDRLTFDYDEADGEEVEEEEIFIVISYMNG
jgi:hypothetical protein